MKIKQAGKQFSSFSVLFCWGFYFLNKAVKSPKSGQKEKENETKRNETKVDAKQAVNRNESTSKLNFVHGCTHDLKQRAANKRMSRQKEERRRKSEAHMRIWPEPRLGNAIASQPASQPG